MLTHSQDFNVLVRKRFGRMLDLDAAEGANGHAGTEVAFSRTSHLLFTAHSTGPLEVHPPMSQRVIRPYIPSFYLSKAWRPIAFK